MPDSIQTQKAMNNLLDSKGINRKKIAALPRYVIVDLVGVIECLIVFACAVLSKLIFIEGSPGSEVSAASYIGVGAIGAALSFFFMRQQDHYNSYQIISRPQQTRRIFYALTTSFSVMIFFGFMLEITQDYSRGWLVTWFVSSFLTVSLVRGEIVSILSKMAKEGNFNKRVVILGEEPLCTRLMDYIESEDVEADVVACYCTGDSSAEGDQVSEDGLEQVVRICKEEHIDQVILAQPASNQKRIQEILLELGRLTTYVDLCPGEVVFDLKNPSFYHIGNIGLYNLQKSPMKMWGAFSKRVLDLCLCIPAIILLSPFMLIIALSIRLSTKGNALFIQDRHGLSDQVIRVIKFQTMRVNEQGASAKQATKNDSRITPIGSFLRKTSLDEIPQLFNVLRGDMSLVGPRPHPLKLNDEFADMLSVNNDYQRMERYASRHRVKPGITGWAQVHGYRGETDTREKMASRIKYDLYYIHHWSIWLDLKIIRMTFLAVIKGNNAY